MDCNLVESYCLLTILVVMVIDFAKDKLLIKTVIFQIFLNQVADNYINNLCTKLVVNS